MATLQKIGESTLVIASLCLIIYLKFRSLENYEASRKHKSGLWGLCKKIA